MNNNDLNVIKPNLDKEADANNTTTSTAPVANNSATVSTTATQPSVAVNSGKPKKKLNIKLILILLIVAVGGYVGYSFISGNGPIGTLGNKKEEEKIEFKTDYDWANKYGEYLQKYFDKADKFDIAFVNLNEEETPELIINYVTANKVNATEILFINNGDVNNTRAYNNASFHLITPINLKDVKWYLYINNDRIYGKYTIVSQLINGTALDATIKATNNEEINYFNSNYLHSGFSLTFYEIKKESFKDNYLTKVERYISDKEKIDNAISSLNSEYDKYIEENNIDLSKEKTIKLNNYTLEVTTYKGMLYELDEDGSQISTELELTFNSLNTLTFKDEELTFTIEGNTITCSNGLVISVLSKNEFQLHEKSVPVTFRIPKEEEKKEDNE